MIKAIAFDLGGVLFSEGKSKVIDELAHTCWYNPAIVSGILNSPESIELRKGLMSDSDFWSWAQKKLPQWYDAQLIKKEWYDCYELDDDIYTLVQWLKWKYTLLIFSGNIKSRVEYLDNKYKFRHIFDCEVYSYMYHVNKPQKEFIEIMIKECGVKPEEIIYIDDRKEFTSAAIPLWVNVIVYSRGKIAQLLKELEFFQILV